MKLLTLITLLLAFTDHVFAQTVDADEIIRKAKNGENVRYENVTIKGVVDLTAYYDEKGDLPRKSWFNGNDNKIENTLRGEITFINCEFTDDFIAYYRDDRSEYTFISHFDSDVTFRDCTFRRDAAFKYSEFREGAAFSNTTFGDNSNFKYAEFKEKSTFEKSVFEDDSDFKYAEFDDMVNFANSVFKEEANFKYAEMEDGVKFTNTIFDGFWNIKYAEMDKDVDLKGIQVNDDLDAKYTKINGRSFNRYLLSDN